MIKTWSYVEEYKDLRKRILNSIDKTLKSGELFFGKQLELFEKNFLKLNKFKYGVAVGSGTDALLIALKTLGIGNNKNDEGTLVFFFFLNSIFFYKFGFEYLRIFKEMNFSSLPVNL